MVGFNATMLTILWIVVMSTCGSLTKEEPNDKQRTKLLVTSMTYFSFPLSLAIFVMAWGLSVRTFNNNGVPYEHKDILHLGAPNTLTPGYVILKYGWHMTLFVGSVLTLYWICFPTTLAPYAPYLPLVMYAAGLLYCTHRFWQFRHFLWMRLKRAFLKPVFADIFFADILTSFSKDLADLCSAMCSLFVLWGWVSTDLDSPNSKCGPHSWAAAIISALPFIVRLIQCVRLQSTCTTPDPPIPPPQQEVPPLEPHPWWNVVKQALQLCIILVSRMYYYKGSSKSWSDGYLPAWIALLVAVSIMSISWDLFVDWNLGIFNWVPGVPTVTTQIFTGQRQWWYYGFILLDILFRISWAWRLSDLDSSCLPFFLSLVEILRRIMWIPLRIEAWQVSQGIPARPVELHGHGGV